MVVKAVILDFGGTLASGRIDWNEFHSAIHCMLKGLIYSVELDGLKKAIKGSLEELERVRARGEEMTLEEVYGSALTTVGVPPDRRTLEMIHDLFRGHYKQSLFPCAEDVLRSVSEHYSIALLSNTMSDQPRFVLERAGLARYFKVILCSRDIGVRKPNPEIFRYVLGRLGVEPNEAVHVGDSVETDMKGAMNAGIMPVWIRNAESQPWTGYAISSICELPEFLASLENG